MLLLVSVSEAFDGRRKPKIVMIEWNTVGLPDRRNEIRSTVLKGPYKEVKDLGRNLNFEREQ